MANRKKRLEKGINSIDEQIVLHEEKKKKALELGQKELARYYEREISSLMLRKSDREAKRDRDR